MKSLSKWNVDDLKITGLDLSLTSPGIAHSRLFHKPSTLSIKTSSEETWFARIKRVAEGIRDEVVKFGPDFIFIENYSFNSKFGRELAGEVHGAVLYQLHEAGYDNTFRVITPLQLKQFITNNTKAKKKDVIQGIKDLYGISFKQSQNDQADAFALALIGEHLVLREAKVPIPQLPKHQEVVVEKALENLRSDSTWLTMFNQK